MKRILATLALLLGALHILSAIPAYPGKIQVTQPDGSVITIRVHGDEWYHYITDERGRVIARGADGFFRPAQKPSEAVREQAIEMQQAARRMRAQAAEAAKASGMTQGIHRIPVILVSFKDTPFTISDPRAAFDALLNEEGYSENGGTGSVRDFYVENSHGQYTPVFDVYGPYELSKNSQSYVNDAGAALKEACQALNSQIDFSQYDSDNDGYVDMTLMYYAGHNPAEGADASKYIWPHQGYVYGNTRFDGKYLYKYFCTSELKGASGSRMCGIGTTTHEFAHSLGLPDFYDTNYGENGYAGGLFSFSTMDTGPYNNNGRTPPYFNAEELIMLGWMDGLTEIAGQGDLTITPIRNRVAYRVPTSDAGEYFLLECRDKTGWDQYIPSGGLLVYHVDKSANHSVGNTTAKNLWDNWTYSNKINAYLSHPCFYLIPAADQGNLQFAISSYTDETGEVQYYFDSSEFTKIPFPGAKRVKTYLPIDWDGNESDFRFTDINYSGGQVTLKVSYTTTPGVEGSVMNTSAKPVRDATVALYAGNSLKKSTTTGADGTYSFKGADLADATYTVRVSCTGYVTVETEVTVSRKVETLDIYLRKEGESTESTFQKYDPAAATETYGNGTGNFATAILLSADELAAYAGKQLKTISFQPAAESGATAAYVFVESGGRRKFTQKVDNLRLGVMNTVNVVAQEYYVPSGSSVYIGYSLLGCTAEKPVMAQSCTADKMGYYGTYNGTSAISWKEMSSGGKYYTPVLSAGVGEPVQPELGFNYIANPGNGTYKAGDRFELTLVRYEDDPYSTLSWTLDGQPVSAGSVTLTAGTHTVEAHLTYPDGTSEVIRLVLKAQ